MKIFENPTIKVSRFEGSNILTASGETPKTTAVQMAQADAEKLGADKTFTLLAD